MIKDSKLYINKFIHNEGLIYLGMRKFGRTKDCLVEESKEETVGILRTWTYQLPNYTGISV